MCVRPCICDKKLIGQAASMALQLCLCDCVCATYIGCSTSTLGASIKEVYMVYLHSCIRKRSMYMHVCKLSVSKADFKADSYSLS